jgi:hypothetical protein
MSFRRFAPPPEPSNSALGEATRQIIASPRASSGAFTPR